MRYLAGHVHFHMNNSHAQVSVVNESGNQHTSLFAMWSRGMLIWSKAACQPQRMITTCYYMHMPTAPTDCTQASGPTSAKQHGTCGWQQHSRLLSEHPRRMHEEHIPPSLPLVMLASHQVLCKYPASELCHAAKKPSMLCTVFVTLIHTKATLSSTTMLPGCSFQSQNIHFNSETSSLHWKSNVLNAMVMSTGSE